MSEHILWETIKDQNEKLTDLEKENRLLGERCNQLLEDKGDLTDQIADIKANCDYILEGKEIEYREERKKLCDGFENMKATLESKIAELKAENELIKNSDSLCKLIGEQKLQIEKMKCCENCKYNSYF